MTFHYSVAVLAVLAFALVLAFAGAWWLGYSVGADRYSPSGEDAQEPVPDPAADWEKRRQELVERDHLARREVDNALSAFRALRSRLERLAAAAHALAKELHEQHAFGMSATPRPPGNPWQPPVQLRRGISRVPAVRAWQGLDRALDLIAAVLDDEHGTLLDLARAMEQLGNATEQLAQDVSNRPSSVAQVAVCTFCGKIADHVRKVFAGDAALICDECVELCVDALEEDYGDNWRTGGAD